jgi:hypothetical protein
LQPPPCTPRNPLRVLFIGNSYTFFHNSPEIFAELARAAAPDREVETKLIASPGATLISLWEAQEALKAIRSSKWDYVVLQDQSQLGDGLRDGKDVVNSPTLLDWGVRLFDGEIRKAGARTMIVLTWSRRNEPDQQADLNYAYDSIARDLGATLVPAGLAWQRVRREDPSIDLYVKDGHHPSRAGSYLLACTLVKSLFPNSTRELPASVVGHAIGEAGEIDMTRKVYLVSLSSEQARRIQDVAKSVVEELRRTGGTLNAPKPVHRRTPVSSGTPLAPRDLAGAWTRILNYYPSPAFLSVALQFEGKKCEGLVVVQIPERNQRYEAPAFDCAMSENTLSFSVVTLPVPLLVDRFVGKMVGGRLIGSVERRGRELTNSMTGVWSLGRQPAGN